MKIVFCLPGSNFSGNFLDSWTLLIGYCNQMNYQVLLSRRESSVVYFARNMCLGADLLRGEDQIPFNGKVDYDYLMWIDSDIVFQPKDLQMLIDKNMDILSGWYMMKDQTHIAVVEKWDEEYFKQNGSFKFSTPQDFIGRVEPIEVAYTGFGFTLIKRGVFEKIKYPWFRPIFSHIGNAVDFSSEDVGFCKLAIDAGFKVCVDPLVRVYHEKSVLL